MDKHQPQSGTQVHSGHEEDTFSARGIIAFIVGLVVCAGLTFVAAAGLMDFFEWWARTHEAKSTPVQQQLNQQRGQLAQKEGVRPQPDWYNREIDAKVLEKTFATPRLQDDEPADLNTFITSEQGWLSSTGKASDGSIHIPISQAIELLSDPKRGLPGVNGTFTAGPPQGDLLAVSEAAQRRLNEGKTQGQPSNKQGQPSNKK